MCSCSQNDDGACTEVLVTEKQSKLSWSKEAVSISVFVIKNTINVMLTSKRRSRPTITEFHSFAFCQMYFLNNSTLLNIRILI